MNKRGRAKGKTKQRIIMILTILLLFIVHLLSINYTNMSIVKKRIDVKKFEKITFMKL